MRPRRKTVSPAAQPPVIAMMQSPFTPGPDDFKPHSWVPCTGWSYALHPVDKIDDPFRRRVTLRSPAGETFRNWIKEGDVADRVIEERGAQWAEEARVSLAIREAILWIEKREAIHNSVGRRLI